MRPDMHKVITERPRHGGGWCYRKGTPRSRDPEEHRLEVLPTKLGMGRCPKNGKGRTKELADNLEPLRKWLWKQHGRRWDDVFSEMSRALPKGVHREHVMSHISAWIGGVTFTNHHDFAMASTWRNFDMIVNQAGILRRNPTARMRYWRLLRRT